MRASDGSYQLLSGNEVGLLLLDYICAQRIKHGTMPAHPTFVKTIVTMDLAEKIADHYGVKTVNVLTGFKFIGEVIGRMEDERDYICGFEESYGYLTGSYVRDKDGVNAAFMIAEMFAFYKTRGVSLLEKLSVTESASQKEQRIHSDRHERKSHSRSAGAAVISTIPCVDRTHYQIGNKVRYACRGKQDKHLLCACYLLDQNAERQYEQKIISQVSDS